MFDFRPKTQTSKQRMTWEAGANTSLVLGLDLGGRGGPGALHELSTVQGGQCFKAEGPAQAALSVDREVQPVNGVEWVREGRL